MFFRSTPKKNERESKKTTSGFSKLRFAQLDNRKDFQNSKDPQRSDVQQYGDLLSKVKRTEVYGIHPFTSDAYGLASSYEKAYAFLRNWYVDSELIDINPASFNPIFAMVRLSGKKYPRQYHYYNFNFQLLYAIDINDKWRVNKANLAQPQVVFNRIYDPLFKQLSEQNVDVKKISEELINIFTKNYPKRKAEYLFGQFKPQGGRKKLIDKLKSGELKSVLEIYDYLSSASFKTPESCLLNECVLHVLAHSSSLHQNLDMILHSQISDADAVPVRALQSLILSYISDDKPVKDKRIEAAKITRKYIKTA